MGLDALNLVHHSEETIWYHTCKTHSIFVQLMKFYEIIRLSLKDGAVTNKGLPNDPYREYSTYSSIWNNP
jgi:hypothetical protein